MKNSIVLLLSACYIITLSCNDHRETAQGSDAAKDSFQIKVQINGLSSGTAKLIYNGPDLRKSDTIASVVGKDGVFTFTGRLEHPEMLLVSLDPGTWTFWVFAENSDIAVRGDTVGAQYFDEQKHGGTKWANLRNYTVTGSASHEVYKRFNNDAALKKQDSIVKQLYISSSKEKDLDKEYKIRDQADSASNVSNSAKQEWIDRYARENPSSVAGVYLFSYLYLFNQNMPIGHMDSSLKLFTPPATTSPYYTFLADNLSKRQALLPGRVAPDFTLRKRDSSSFNLASTRGRYVMLDFWASWCHPCRQAIPHWKKVYAGYHPKGLDIVSISDDSDWKDWKKAMDAEKMPWQQVCDEFPEKDMPSRVGSLYMTSFIPFYVLLDKEGKILVYSGNERDIDAKLKELFGAI